MVINKVQSINSQVINQDWVDPNMGKSIGPVRLWVLLDHLSDPVLAWQAPRNTWQTTGLGSELSEKQGLASVVMMEPGGPGRRPDGNNYMGVREEHAGGKV